jgi:serine protease Do
MTRRQPPPFLLRALAALLALSLLLTPAARADDAKPKQEVPLPAALDKAAPESVEDLKAIQQQLKKVVEKVIPCTVNVRDGAGQGSGVIVSEDGLVLTAGHVSRDAGREVTLTLHDGKKVKAKTLGANKEIDSGMLKITESGKWPHAELGKSADLKKGQWVVTVGHPGGWKPDRSPPVRLGRVLDVNDKLIRTDCTIVGGDSGGPLFDMTGKVIGIHSRIGGPLTANIHVPVDTYRDTWDRLVKGEVWPVIPYLGFRADRDADNCKVAAVVKGSPAEKGGLKVDDVITQFDGKTINTFDDLGEQLKKKKPGEEVTLEVKRGKEVVTLKIVVGNRG